MIKVEILNLLKELSILSALMSLFLTGWEWGMGKEVQTRQVILLWVQRLLTILLVMAFLTLDLLSSTHMSPLNILTSNAEITGERSESGCLTG